MGLKNTNYKINGFTYNEVYAVFNGSIKKFGNEYMVGFNVHATRELALKEQPLQVLQVRLNDWDRKTDIVAYAYQKGKQMIKTKQYNHITDKVEDVYTDNVFTGWEDDIV